MSNQNERNQRSLTTTTTEKVEEQAGASLEALTPREEKVLRMLHGMGEDDSHRLQFALGADEDARVKLAMIERQLLDCISAPADDDDNRISPAELLASWLDQE